MPPLINSFYFFFFSSPYSRMRGEYYRVAARMRETRHALQRQWEMICDEHPDMLAQYGDRKDFFEKLDAAMMRVQHDEFVKAQAEASKLADLVSTEGEMCVHATLRPQPGAIDFASFRSLVLKAVEAKVLKDYCFVFEQVGTSQESLGEGFHAHIVARLANGRTMSHVKNTWSKLSTVCPGAGFLIKPAGRPWGIIEKYFAHISKDGHKEVTAEWDTVWRNREGLKAMYGNPEAFRPIPLPSCEGDGPSTLRFD